MILMNTHSAKPLLKLANTKNNTTLNSMKRTVFFCLLFFSFLLVIAASVSTSFFFSKEYNAIIVYFVKTLKKTDSWIPYFQTKFSPKAFSVTKKIIIGYDILVVAILSLAGFHLKKIVAIGVGFINGIIISVKNFLSFFTKLSTFEKWFFYSIVLFAFAKAIWYDATLLIQYDEAWSYNYYESNSFWESFLLPGNNHKLYTCIAWFFNLLPFDKTFLIRLPVSIAGILLLAVFFRFVKRYFSTGIALIGFAWFASCVPVAVYMTIARSYIFVTLFSLLLLEIYLKILNTTSKRGNYVSLFLILIAGYFTNPVFFFAHMSISLYMCYKLLKAKEYVKIKAIIYLHITVLIAGLLMYIPDILGGHFNNMMTAAFKQPTADNYFVTCLKYNGWFQLGIEENKAYLLFIVIISTAFVLYFINRLQPKILLEYALFSIVWLPFYALFAHDDTSIHKVIYITISVTFLLMFILSAGIGRYLIKNNILIIISLIIIIINSINMNKHGWFKWSAGEDAACKKISATLLSNHIADCYLLDAAYYKQGIQFYLKINSKQIPVYLSEDNSVDYSPTAFKNAASIVVNRDLDTSINKTIYNLQYQDSLVKFYVRRN